MSTGKVESGGGGGNKAWGREKMLSQLKLNTAIR